MTREELIAFVADECKKNNWCYLMQIDDGKTIAGQYHVATNSRLHNMAREVNKLTDHYEESID